MPWILNCIKFEKLAFDRPFVWWSHFTTTGWYTLGDKLQQHVAVTCCSDKSLRLYWKSFVKIFVAATEFVATTSPTDSVWFDFLWLVTETKFCCRDKDFHKNSPVHMKWFVAATCRLTLLLQLVACPVHMDWSVTTMCCSNLSPSVYRPYCFTAAVAYCYCYCYC